ncbi:MAG: PQQ-dependent dehydrogenase, methanol/ethanol family [Pseudomonadota bacterium]
MSIFRNFSHRSSVAALCAALLAMAGCSQETSDNAADAAGADSATVEAVAAAQAKPAAANVDGERIVNANSEPGSWLSHGRTYDEQRFSPLDQINAESVSELGLAWHFDTGTKRGLEATPLMIDGVLYSSGSWSVVWAHDARTGKLLWEFDPEVPRAWGKYACCDVVNRGVAAWEGKIFVGTLDGRLIALNADDGSVLWSIQTTDPERPYTITGAPRVVKGKVIIGNGGAEYGVRGYVSAYDANTGDQAWRFYTVPGDPSKPFENEALEQAAATWRGGKWWEIGGGGTVWDSMAYDPELDQLYIGVGNGSPWNRYIRSPGGGDNLYLSSILSLDPDDGSLNWHYQTTPGDTWDYTATQHMILADLELGGEQRKVLMQAPKNGFFYVIDRTNGQFISAEAYVNLNWATHVDPETGRPVENPDAHYANGAKLVWPAPYGGHNWHPMTYHPSTNLVYIPVLDIPFMYGQDNGFQYNSKEWNTGVDVAMTQPPSDPEAMVSAMSMVKGYLTAWDPTTQQEKWRVEHEMSWNGGLLSTAGNLIFQGRADGTFAAYTADEGKLVWEFPASIGIIAAPMTYELDGEQYVTVVAGWGGAFALASGVPRHRNNALTDGRILTFKLGATAELPQVEVAYLDIPEPPAMETAPEQVAHGAKLYHSYCSVCHGPGVVGGTPGIPDLRYSTAAVHASWDAIVRLGAYAGKGMARFDHVLEPDDAEAIQAYVVDSTRNTIALCESEYRKNYPELVGNACVRAQVASAATPPATAGE